MYLKIFYVFGTAIANYIIVHDHILTYNNCNNNFKNFEVMKTIKSTMLAIAIILGTSAFASVNSNPLNEDNAIETVSQTNDDGFVAVKFGDLNEKVQAAIQGYTEAFDVTALAYNAEKKLTKVTLSSKADQSVKIVILDDEGKEYVEPAE